MHSYIHSYAYIYSYIHILIHILIHTLVYVRRYEPYMQLSVPIPDSPAPKATGEKNRNIGRKNGDNNSNNNDDDDNNDNNGDDNVVDNDNDSGNENHSREVVLVVHILPRHFPPEVSPPLRTPSTSSPSTSPSSPSSPSSSSSIIKCHVSISLISTIQDILMKIINGNEYSDISTVSSEKRYICCKIKKSSSGYFKISGAYPLTMEIRDLEQSDCTQLW